MIAEKESQNIESADGLDITSPQGVKRITRRDRTEINAQLLKISRTGALKTQLVYGGNLNFRIIKKYLRILMDRGLLQKTGDLYFTTDMGREYIYHSDSLRS